jgi:hypothetical protein
VVQLIGNPELIIKRWLSKAITGDCLLCKIKEFCFDEGVVPVKYASMRLEFLHQSFNLCLLPDHQIPDCCGCPHELSTSGSKYICMHLRERKTFISSLLSTPFQGKYIS